jgi:hypothetical protein
MLTTLHTSQLVCGVVCTVSGALGLGNTKTPKEKDFPNLNLNVIVRDGNDIRDSSCAVKVKARLSASVGPVKGS